MLEKHAQLFVMVFYFFLIVIIYNAIEVLIRSELVVPKCSYWRHLLLRVKTD